MMAAATTSCGVRRERSRLRRVSTKVSDTKVHTPLGRKEWGLTLTTDAVLMWSGSLGGEWCDLQRFGGRLPGEAQEDIVERGAAHAEVLDGDAAVLDSTGGRQQGLHPLAGGQRDPLAAQVRQRRAGAQPVQETDEPFHVTGTRRSDLDDVAAEALLEVVGAAGGDDAAPLDHGDAIGQPVGLLEVLGRQ